MDCQNCKGLRIKQHEEIADFEKQMEGVRRIAEGEENIYVLEEPNFRIMVWKEARNHLACSEGWFHIHDEVTGEPIECKTIEEVQAEVIEQLNQGCGLENLKIVREYPFKVNLELRQGVRKYHED